MNFITIQSEISAPISQVWEKFTNENDVKNWNFASDDWHCPEAKNHLAIGEKFCFTMASKDEKMSFDFGGTYTEIIPEKSIKYTLDDGRKVEVFFEKISENETKITENFEGENTHEKEFQKAGWQAILDNFKKYTENIS